MLSETLVKLIKHRRNIKPIFFSEERIPDQIIHQMLEVANWAPTHGHTEPWRFVVFTDEALKDLGAFQSKLYKEKTAAEDFQQKKYDKLAAVPQMASHCIAVVCKKGPKEKIPMLEEIAATSCAVQNILLVAAAENIGVHWGSGGVTYWEETKSYLGFEQQDQVLGFLYLGYPKNEWPQGRRLSNTNAKVDWRS